MIKNYSKHHTKVYFILIIFFHIS